MLFYGNVLADSLKGKVNSSVGGQADIAVTLLNGLGINSSEFTWGQDLFDAKREQFASYSHINGFGWVTRGGYLVYDHKTSKPMMDSFDNPNNAAEAERNGKAYLQHLMDEYMRY